MATLLELTSQGDVGTITDESKLSKVKLMDPQQLYELWERQPWSAHAIDLEKDIEDWENVVTQEEKDALAYNLSAFFIGEERVATQFSGLVRAYEDQGEEAFLTTQQVDEVRHAQFFNRFYARSSSATARSRAAWSSARDDVNEAFIQLFDVELVNAQEHLLAEPGRPRGEGRLRRALPHGHRGDARADRPVLHAGLPREAGQAPGPARGLPADLAGRAPPRRLRHLVPPAEVPPTPRSGAASRPSCRSSSRSPPACSSRPASRTPTTTSSSATTPRRRTSSRSTRCPGG